MHCCTRNVSRNLTKLRLQSFWNTLFVIKQIGLPLRGRPILLITRMITDRIGLHSVLLPLLIWLLFFDKMSVTFCIFFLSTEMIAILLSFSG